MKAPAVLIVLFTVAVTIKAVPLPGFSYYFDFEVNNNLILIIYN